MKRALNSPEDWTCKVYDPETGERMGCCCEHAGCCQWGPEVAHSRGEQ